MTKQLKVYDYTKNKRNISMYYSRDNSNNAMNVTIPEYESWLQEYGLTKVPMACGEVQLETEISIDEYWEDLPKREHMSDMTLFLSELFEIKK